MKIRMLNSREEIDRVNNEDYVHLSFRPSSVDLLSIIKQCPELQMIQIPSSYMKTISADVSQLLKMNGIEFIEGELKGSWIDKYKEVDN
jgi:hypothetical protein